MCKPKPRGKGGTLAIIVGILDLLFGLFIGPAFGVAGFSALLAVLLAGFLIGVGAGEVFLALGFSAVGICSLLQIKGAQTIDRLCRAVRGLVRGQARDKFPSLILESQKGVAR